MPRAKLLLNVAVAAAAFLGTLIVLDHWQVPTVSQPGPNVVYSLDMAHPNWSVVDPARTQVSVTTEGVSVGSIMPPNLYQLSTDRIPVKVNGEYDVSYTINVSKGKFQFGVLDAVNDKWIVQKVIDQRSDAITFTAPTREIQVILFGISPPPTAATLSSLAIVGPPE
jgi:hypothetical protein